MCNGIYYVLIKYRHEALYFLEEFCMKCLYIVHYGCIMCIYAEVGANYHKTEFHRTSHIAPNLEHAQFLRIPTQQQLYRYMES